MTGGDPGNGCQNGILDLMELMIGERGLPVPMELSSDPFHVLVSTIISLRTRDAVTSTVSAALLGQAPDPVAMLALEPAELEALLRPAGFYRQKAAQLRQICAILLERHGGRVPATTEELMALPGVGLKTASFMMGMVFGEPAVCVDVHVHRISNRIGLVSTGTPEQSKAALEVLFPLERWTGINHIMVRFGQKICRPVRPLCGACRLQRLCVHAGGIAKL
jgi:endonuclease III